MVYEEDFKITCAGFSALVRLKASGYDVNNQIFFVILQKTNNF